MKMEMERRITRGRYSRLYLSLLFNTTRHDVHLTYVIIRTNRYSRRQLYSIIADTSSYPSFVPFCHSTRILRASSSALSPSPSPSTNSPSSPVTPSKSLQEHLQGKGEEILDMDVEMTVKFLVHKESYVSVVTCRPFESVMVRPHSSFFQSYSEDDV